MKRGLISCFLLAAGLSLLISPEIPASPGKLITVCPSGCDQTSLQSAINSISGSSSTNIYTILLEAGIHSSDASISLNGKSYINIVGRGIGGSILQASALWFQNSAGLLDANFLDLSDSEHILLQDLTIDARSQDPGGLGSGTSYRAILAGPGPTNPVSLTIKGCEVLGLTNAVYDIANSGGGTVDVFNSRILGDHNGIRIYGTLWHVFSSDIRAEPKPGASGFQTGVASAVSLGGTDNSQFWGSHLHAEDAVGLYISAVDQSKIGGSTAFVGCTLHLKVTTTAGVSSRRQTVFSTAQGGGVKTNFVGSDLIYQTPSDMTSGYIGGLSWVSSTGTHAINLIGSEIIDMGGSGGSTLPNGDIARGDIVGFSTSGKPTIRTTGSKAVSTRALLTGGPISGIDTSHDTLSQQNGTATIASASTSASVTLAAPMPDANYRVSLSASAGQVVWVSGKTTTGFTLNRTTTGTALNIDWLVAR